MICGSARLTKVALLASVGWTSLILSSSQNLCAFENEYERTIREKVAALEAKLDFSQAEFDRTKKLHESNLVTLQKLEAAEWDLLQAKIELAAAKKDRKNTVELCQVAIRLREAKVDRLLTLHQEGAVAESAVTDAKRKLLDARTQLIDAKAANQLDEVKGKILGNEPSLELTALLKERREVLQQRAAMVEARFRAGTASFHEVATAANDLMYAELAIARMSEDRIAIYEKIIANLRRLESAVGERVRAGQATRDDLLLAKAARLKVQIELAQERASSK